MTAATVATPPLDIASLLIDLASVEEPGTRARMAQHAIESLSHVRDDAVLRAVRGEVPDTVYAFCEKIGMGKAETMKVVARQSQRR
jgi:hypothetical protein